MMDEKENDLVGLISYSVLRGWSCVCVCVWFHMVWNAFTTYDGSTTITTNVQHYKTIAGRFFYSYARKRLFAMRMSGHPISTHTPRLNANHKCPSSKPLQIRATTNGMMTLSPHYACSEWNSTYRICQRRINRSHLPLNPFAHSHFRFHGIDSIALQLSGRATKLQPSLHGINFDFRKTRVKHTMQAHFQCMEQSWHASVCGGMWEWVFK